ncbi:hypothetical protein MMC07_005271 [Pseudocyphellaria aurata]|nr:hypothetical protein [Pseudocyphellaria aurata]
MKTAVDTDMRPSQSMMSSTSQEREVSESPAKVPLDPFTEVESPLSSKKAFLSWLLLCYSTGPTSSMTATYVPISLQAMANILGHQPGSAKKCATRGAIRCLVSFGSGEVDYNSYVLYLQAIARACEGILTIFLSGIADYSHYRKSSMLVTIILFGVLALPFAALTHASYTVLTASSVLYCLLTTIQGAYGTMEASYIPLFMRASGWYQQRPRINVGRAEEAVEALEQTQTGSTNTRPSKRAFNKGVRVSVLGLFVGNVGSLTALLIGLIITNTRGQAAVTGYHNFLLAITIAGCLTIVFGTIGGFVIPSVPGKKRNGENLLTLSVIRFISLLKSIRNYPEAFKLCIGWILWNTAYSAHNSILSLLFRETLGLGSSDGEYTTWTFTAILFASMGSLSWMFAFPHVRCKVKTWAYTFFAVNITCIVWGALGINSHVPIGYKHRPEFWIEQVLFLSTSSALRSWNRVVYSSMLPHGREAQFFGLEITLDLATGWISPLVQGVIQDRTHNLRFPMIPNSLLMLIALGFYVWVDIEKGIADALKESGAGVERTGP